jgi:Rrf2 family protein
MISSTAEYALRAIVYLAQHARNGRVPAAEVAANLGIPANYLGKILHELARAGVLKSTRGKNGGFSLATSEDKLSLYRVVSLFDDLGNGSKCLLGRPECSDLHPCDAHARWKSVSEQVNRFFQETTVGDLLGGEKD